MYVFDSNKGLGGNWGSEIFISSGRQQTSNTISCIFHYQIYWMLKKGNHGACDSKQPLRTRPQQCVRKHFLLISFLSQWKIQLIVFLQLKNIANLSLMYLTKPPFMDYHQVQGVYTQIYNTMVTKVMLITLQNTH